MYTINLVNFGFNTEMVFENFEQAVDHAKATGFECTILRDGVPIVSTSPLIGQRNLGPFGSDPAREETILYK